MVHLCRRERASEQERKNTARREKCGEGRRRGVAGFECF